MPNLISNPNLDSLRIYPTVHSTEDLDDNGALVDESLFIVNLVSAHNGVVSNDSFIHIPIEPANRANGSMWISLALPTANRDVTSLVFSYKDQSYDIGYKFIEGDMGTNFKSMLEKWAKYHTSQNLTTRGYRIIKLNFYGALTNKKTETTSFNYKFNWDVNIPIDLPFVSIDPSALGGISLLGGNANLLSPTTPITI